MKIVKRMFWKLIKNRCKLWRSDGQDRLRPKMLFPDNWAPEPYEFMWLFSFIIAKVVGIFFPLRVDAETEHEGLDLAVHGERAYSHD